MMTDFEAVVSMAQTLLRARGQWTFNATAHADIESAVTECADLINGTRALRTAAIRELKIRAGY